MNARMHFGFPKLESDIARGAVQRGVQVFAILLIYAVLLFTAAGRLGWLVAWAYLAVYLITVLVNMSIIITRNPEFAAERGRTKQDAKGWDQKVTAIAGLFMIAGLVVPGLDLRFGWSPQFPMQVQVAGLLGLVFGYVLFSWAMLSNEFFETQVRIQAERGQQVCSTGPYRLVRHPGYAGIILQLLATPFLLGSLWGILPAVCAAAMFILRTALEDMTLRDELDGYRDYAERVRYRLLPGVW